MSPFHYHEVFAALVAHDVRFVVVGGVAVNLQGVPRFTADLDVVVPLEPENLRRLTEAVESLGLAPRLPVAAVDLADVGRVRRWIRERNLRAFTFQDPENPLREVDVLLDAPLTFEEIDATADEMTAAGLTLRVASAETLIRMKSGTGRAQDHSDVDALRRVLALDHGD